MKCLEHKLAFSLSVHPSGKTDTFVADIFQPRPEFDDMVAYATPWCGGAAESVRTSMDRPLCAVDFVQLVVDDVGMLVLMHFRKRLTLAHAKVAAVAILSYLPQAQRDIVEAGLRPVDELDYNRIAEWKTAEDVRPPSPAKERARRARDTAEVVEPTVIEVLPELPEEERKQRAAAAKAAEEAAAVAPMTVADFLASLSDSDDDDHSHAPLMITDAEAASAEPEDISTLTVLDPAHYSSLWLWRVRRETSMILLEVGGRPGSFAYHRCYREARRQLLMQRVVSAKFQTPCMLQVVQIAMEMATDGAIPQPGAHGRRQEFMQRCADTLKAICPSAETDVMNLDNETQTLIRRALAGTAAPAPYQGCLTMGCLDQDTNWVVRDLALPGESPMPMSTCSRCGQPKAVGRTVHSIRDILSLMERRAHGSFFARVAANYRVDLRDHDRV